MLASKIHTWGMAGSVMLAPVLPPGEASCCKTLLLLDPVCVFVLRKRSEKGANLSLCWVKPICMRNHSQIVCSWQLWQDWSSLILSWEKPGKVLADSQHFKVSINTGSGISYPTPGNNCAPGTITLKVLGEFKASSVLFSLVVCSSFLSRGNSLQPVTEMLNRSSLLR